MPTHVRVTRYATCIQWDGSNTQEVLDMLHDAGDEAHRFGDDNILIRHKDTAYGRKDIETISTGWWLRKGEDGRIKCLPDLEFKMHYQPIKKEI